MVVGELGSPKSAGRPGGSTPREEVVAQLEFKGSLEAEVPFSQVTSFFC